MPVDPLLLPPATTAEPAPELPLGGDLDPAVCARGPKIPELDPLTYINLGRGGRLNRSGAYASDLHSVRRQVDLLAKGDCVFVYLHGGLNGEKEAGEDACTVIPWIRNDLKMPPLCVIWETLPWIAKVCGGGDGGEDRQLPERLKERQAVVEQTFTAYFDGSLADIPRSSVKALWRGADQAPRRRELDEASDENDAAEEDAQDGPGTTESLEPAFVQRFQTLARSVRLGRKGRRRCLDALEQTVWRVYKGLDHGLRATLLEELLHGQKLHRLATRSWRKMKEKAAKAYRPNSSDTDHPRGGSYLLDQLQAARLKSVGEGGAPLALHVWGQSAGTIHASYLVSHVARNCPNLRVETLIFSNAGVRFDVFAKQVLPHLAKVGRLILFGLTSQAEATDLLLPSDPDGYPASLLTVVSGLLEAEVDAALMGLERMFNGESARQQEPVVKAVIEALKALGPGRFVHEMSPQGPLTFTSHGGEAGPIEDDSVRKRLVQLLTSTVQSDGPLV